MQSGRLLQSYALSNVFSRLFYKHTQVSIAFSDYRQMVAYFARVSDICGSTADHSDSDDDKPPSDISLVQFGHSTAVADAHYGRHSGEHPKLRETRLHEFRLVSEKWHRFISHEGIRPAVAEQVGATASSGRRIGADVDIDTRPAQSDVDSDTRPARSDVDSDTRPAQSDVDSDIRLARSDIYSDSRSEAPVSYRASSTKIVKHVESHRSLQFLRQYFRDRNAVFKSPEQRAAVENVLFTTSDIIAVLPTGCGKSLIFFLYSFVFPNLTSVVVVPTVLLKQDLLRRAAEKGISSSDHPWGG